MPKIKELRINYVKPLDEGMLAFLKNSIKKPIMNFSFNWGGRIQNGDYYANGLINALENVEQKIYISNLTLSQPNTIAFISCNFIKFKKITYLLKLQVNWIIQFTKELYWRYHESLKQSKSYSF